MDWTKGAKGLPAANSGFAFMPPYATSVQSRTATDISQTTTLSQPLAGRSTSSLVSDKTTSRAPQEGAGHQRSFSSMASQSTAHSGRRERKRSSRFPSEASSSSRKAEGQSPSPILATTPPKVIYADVKGESFDISRESLDSKASSTRKLQKSRVKTEGAQEGTFRKRVASIRRRISGSLSTGPSTVMHSSRSRGTDEMPPPPVPASAFRTSSLANALPTLRNTTTRLPRVSFDGQRDSQSALGLEAVHHSAARESLDAGMQARNVSGLASSESGSSVPVSHPSGYIAELAGRETAISPTLPSDVHLVPPCPSPTPSVISLASHKGGYGFHLPSPAAGSAYNMFGSSQDSSSQCRQVLDPSADPGHGMSRTVSHSEQEVALPDERDTPKAKRPTDRQSDRKVSRPSLYSNPSGGLPLPGLSITPSNTILDAAALGQTPRRVNSGRQVTPTSIEKNPVLSGADVDESMRSKRDEKSLLNFRFGSKTTALPSSTQPSLPEITHRPTSVASSVTALTNQGAPGKTRLALRRIGSISRRHSRRISDGWRAVSGQSSSPAKIQSMRPDSGSTPSVEIAADQEPDAARRSLTVAKQSSVRKLSPSTEPSTSGVSPNLQTSGKATATPPRPKMLSPTSLRLPIQSGSEPSPMPLTPTAMRSLSQNDSPSTLKINVSGGEGDGRTESRPAGQQRRNSLGDLKIPSRVVSAQKGLKEEIGAMKHFAAGVQGVSLVYTIAMYT